MGGGAAGGLWQHHIGRHLGRHPGLIIQFTITLKEGQQFEIRGIDNVLKFVF